MEEWGTYLVSGHRLEGYRSWVETPQAALRESEIAYMYMCIMYSHGWLSSSSCADRGLINTRQAFERMAIISELEENIIFSALVSGWGMLHGLMLSMYVQLLKICAYDVVWLMKAMSKFISPRVVRVLDYQAVYTLLTVQLSHKMSHFVRHKQIP